MILKLLEADFQQRVAHHQQTQNLGNDTEQQPERNLAADGESATQQILGRIFTVPSDSTRAILFLNDSDLKDRYLSSGGEQKIVDAATDEQIAAVFTHADFQLGSGPADANAAFLFEVKDFDLTTLDRPFIAKRPYAVLLNVPKNVAQFFNSKKPADMEEARKVFAEIISHKNYVATLNANAIKKAGIGALDDRDEREEKFNVKKFITAFPVRSLIDAARAEQDERDRQNSPLPNGETAAPADGEAAAPAPEPLTTPEKELAKTIARKVAEYYFKISARSANIWPTTPEGMKHLRERIIKGLIADTRIGDNKKIIPEIVKQFHKLAKVDSRYPELLKLLKGDENFMKLAAGELTAADNVGTTDDGGDFEDEPTAQDAAADAAPAEPAGDKTPDELAAEIQAKGDDFADQVAKILSGKKASTAAEPASASASSIPDDLPDDVKVEVEKLTKVKNNAINPKQREKAAADLARILHQHEEKKKAKKPAAKKKAA